MPITTHSDRPSPRSRRPAVGEGLSQHSLVEHALCPLDARVGLRDGLLHATGYRYQDRNRNTKRAEVTVAAPFGLSPHDEFYLWGLLALHLAHSGEDATELVATPHWCLRRLGVVSSTQGQGKRYELFREAIRRLAGVVYRSTAFYDPVRGEHRDVAFGLLKYSLPVDPASSRAWRIQFDPQFLDFCRRASGGFAFDLATYRDLDPASRRLFLLLSKIFWRRTTSPAFDVRHLAVDVLGFDGGLSQKHVNEKLVRVATKLLALDVIALPPGVGTPRGLLVRRGKGEYRVTLHRGGYFDRSRDRPASGTADSPLVDPLRTIGFDGRTIAAILRDHSPRLVGEWADITLAAVERGLVRKDPRAYFRHYLAEAAAKRTTPPDWWRELRKQEERRQWERERRRAPTIADAMQDDFETRFEAHLAAEGREAYTSVLDELLRTFRSAGHDDRDARLRAEKMARDHLRNRFRGETSG